MCATGGEFVCHKSNLSTDHPLASAEKTTKRTSHVFVYTSIPSPNLSHFSAVVILQGQSIGSPGRFTHTKRSKIEAKAKRGGGCYEDKAESAGLVGYLYELTIPHLHHRVRGGNCLLRHTPAAG